ncbi:MAG: DUF2007 domain-containing protein [Chloroflexota bacterium]|nr:DUF2007 domain-containing protein [Chloroflexota bacterium]
MEPDGLQWFRMKRVYSSQGITIVHHFMNILENEGIACLIKNEDLLRAAGGLPLLDCWPELWITDDSQYEQAQAIIEKAVYGQTSTGSTWKCPGCGEEHESQFSDCWNCGTSRV